MRRWHRPGLSCFQIIGRCRSTRRLMLGVRTVGILFYEGCAFPYVGRWRVGERVKEVVRLEKYIWLSILGRERWYILSSPVCRFDSGRRCMPGGRMDSARLVGGLVALLRWTRGERSSCCGGRGCSRWHTGRRQAETTAADGLGRHCGWRSRPLNVGSHCTADVHVGAL